MHKKKKRKIKVIYRKLAREKVWGLAYFEHDIIEIDSRLNKKRLLSTILHEGLHLANESLSESTVLKMEKILADLLWQEGYRKVDQ